MKIKEAFARYDSAEHLKDEADIAAYMNAAMEEAGDDPAFVMHALGVVARARGMTQLAEATAITREGLYKALSGNGNPSFGTVVKVAKAMGLKIEMRPIKAQKTTGRRRSAKSNKKAAHS